MSTAIRVRDVEKTFRIPVNEPHTLKERALHPFRKAQYEELRALRGVSFDVERGEFFGIVGRNGSGKSTLLKCLAGIYRADAGRMEMAGTVAPFIELGVGFNPELTAADNIVINAVMMGLSPREARARHARIVDFAELHDFTDLRLKNYSSGMQVRLAFAVMVQSDADVLLIDEVLAVGDAAFQQKCVDEFHRLRESGRTIVLVTHDMEQVERFCHRAILIADGLVAQDGDPGRVGHEYLALNFEHAVPAPEPEPEPGPEEADDGTAAPDLPGPRAGEEVRLLDVRLTDDRGAPVSGVPHGSRFRAEATLELDRAVDDAWGTLWLDDASGLRIFGASAPLGPLPAGARVRLRLRTENPLRSGRYYAGVSLERGIGAGDFHLFEPRVADVVVFGGDAVGGLIAADHDLEAERLDDAAEATR
jgi:ABC-type polysaccharide/polyol phosphate transport system ATPase subunit